MSSLIKKLEVSANIAIILLALLIGTILTKNYVWPGKAAGVSESRQRSTVQPGAKLSLSEVDWERNGQTLILALSNDCHYCTESASFYQKIVSQREGKNLKVIAILPQDIQSGQNYLNGLGVAVDEVKQASLSSIQVSGTPTLLLVDSKGVVKEVWVGKLPSDKEAQALSKILA
jgi:peroxiredoxin